MGDKRTYRVVRMYLDETHPDHLKVIAINLSLEEAQAHCQRDDTHGEGWFDGYDAEQTDAEREDRGAQSVSDWFGNDEGLYTWARESIREQGFDGAVAYLFSALRSTSTPDGYAYTRPRIERALRDLFQEE